VAPEASAAYDQGCDVLAPPPPPGGFDARLETTTEDVLTDYRSLIGPWEVAFSSDAGPVTLTWDPSQLPSDGFFLRDSFGGILLEVDMNATNSTVITNLALSPLRIEYDGPTAITLAAFNAVAQPDGSVRVTWETATEIDNAGFNVYRSATATFDAATAIQVNPSMVAAQAQFSLGASYELVDETVPPGVWYYFLEDVELGGTTTLHEPVSVNTFAPTSVGLTTVAETQAIGMTAVLIMAATGFLLWALMRRRMRGNGDAT
jgi:hypothetical protein